MISAWFGFYESGWGCFRMPSGSCYCCRVRPWRCVPRTWFYENSLSNMRISDDCEHLFRRNVITRFGGT